MNLYDFVVLDQNGNEVSLDKFKGKVVLVVNTATGCGFTPQYNELQKLYEEFAGDGFEILDFPCNQFGEQAPGTNEEIHDFCQVRYKITFPQFAKIDVNGENAIELYNWLTKNTKFEGFGTSPMGLAMKAVAYKNDADYKNNGRIKWNFTKFLIDRNGDIAYRLEPTQMKELKEKIMLLL